MVEFITNGEYLVNKPLLNPFCCVLPDRGRPACPLGGEDHHTLHDHDQVRETQSVGDTCPPDKRSRGTKSCINTYMYIHWMFMCVSVSVMSPYFY